ncbi:MAG: 3-deoxy-manno-octulosonate cytidylyltransferase [Desulfobacteraceae bacterium]|nr:3-deoxy-manno-octulosonate cytidylyltransferase [Desulfobacteraceae bacterium]
MKIFAFIPARYQSTRFPGKPLALIAGKPLIQHVYERATSCPEFFEVYVATDDERISDCVHGFGGKVVITGEQHRSGTDRICEAALKIGLKKNDIVVNIQGDQPLFHPSHISQLVKPLMDDSSILMTTLKWKVTEGNPIQSPKDVTVVTDIHDFALYFSRSKVPFFRNSESGEVYYKHLGLYGFRMEFLAQFTCLSEGVLEFAEKLEQLRALEYGFKIKVLETPFDSIEVDTPGDIERVEKIL